MKLLKFVFVSIVLGCLANLGYCDRIKNNIYDNVDGAFCFRRLNGTHQTGCSSKNKGSVGVLHHIEKDSDFDFVLNNPPAPPYVPILAARFFTRENILKLQKSPFVSGIVLVNDTEKLDTFSHDSKCPNQFSAYAKQPKCDVLKPETTWNPFGTNLMYEDFEIPIMFLSSQNESKKVIDCFKKFNTNLEKQAESSLCSIEIVTFMSAAGNSEICRRRSQSTHTLSQTRYCDPLQGKNIYATVFPRQIINPDNRTVNETEKFIMVSARLDTTSMFDGVGLGAVDSLASAATLISIGHYLRKILSDTDFNSQNLNVLFVLFNGESYDYIGSQRFVFDLKNENDFPALSSYTNPINFESIVLMIDIGPLDSFNDLHFYQLNDFELGKNFASYVQPYSTKFNISLTSLNTDNMPPTSAQSFLRESMSFPVLVVATRKPTNQFYHSIYDDVKNLNYTYFNTSKDFDQLDDLSSNDGSIPSSSVQVKIRNISTVLAMGIYEMITGGKYTKNLAASSVMIDELLHCYLESTNCPLFKATMKEESFHGNNYPPQRYISVQSSFTLEATGWAYRVFGFVLSEKVANYTKENCTVMPMYWMPGSKTEGECRRTTQNLSYAISPAFTIDGYDFKSNRYSLWTESTWNALSARIFLHPSATHESLTLSIGFVVMIISFVIVYLVNTKTDVLFASKLTNKC
ncbi:unnamed protein product [Diamesa tonsa]